MPVVEHVRLQGIVAQLLQAAGASAEEASIVSRHSVAANLAGHDSHGVIQIPIYIDRIGKGHIVPGAPFEIKQESATSTVVDGNWGFGYVVSEQATRLTIEKARQVNVAATTIVQQSHIGRVAAYPLMAAREGMIAIMTADSGRGPKQSHPSVDARRVLAPTQSVLRCHRRWVSRWLWTWQRLQSQRERSSWRSPKGPAYPVAGWLMRKAGRATIRMTMTKAGCCCHLAGRRGIRDMVSP